MSGVPWTWFVMRSSGLVAVGLLTISVALGLAGTRLRPTARLTTVSVHRGAGIAGAVLIALHVVLAVTDKWITLDWPAAFVPGTSSWQRWGVGLGALALDLLMVVMITTATRLRAPGLWQRTHLLAYPLWALAVGHGLLVGSDPAMVRVEAAVCASIVLMALAVRVMVPASVAGPDPMRRAPIVRGA